MNGMSGAKRRSYTGAFRLMQLLKILGTQAGRKYGISENHSRLAWPAEDCLGPALQYGSLHHSEQAWLVFFSCCAGSDGCFSVALGELYYSNYRFFQ